MKEIKNVKVSKGMKVSELVEEMNGIGFGAGKIAVASGIMKKMFEDKDCKVFLGIAGAMVPAGMREIILDLLDTTDVFVTTGANLTHDLIESLGEKHYKLENEELVDDVYLNEKGLDRIYNVLMKNSVYEKLEDFFSKNFEELKKCSDISEFLVKLGEIVSSAGGKGILAKCYEKKIPIFCPGIADSGIGLMMWSGNVVRKSHFPTDSSAKHPNQGRTAEGKGKTCIDVFSDINKIIDISWTAKKTGVIYIGGGLPKNFIQQALQFSKGADYGVQITTDRAEPGGSSGAPLKEGISWGKMKKDADFVDVFCDATIAIPLIYASLK